MPVPFFQRRIEADMNTHIAVARFEDVCKTVCASRCVSALPSFSPHHVGSLAKESRRFTAEGLN